MKLIRGLLLLQLFVLIGYIGFSQVDVTRGPYLQKATQNSIVVRWSTNDFVGSKISYGNSMGNYNFSTFDTNKVLHHSVTIQGLVPNKTYFYTVESVDSLLRDGPNLFFKTLPETGDQGDYSFLVLGDPGQGSLEQREVSLALQNYYGIHYDGMILLGDNAYYNGTQSEYQNNFFDGFYNEIIENTVIWPSPGNHDYYGASVPTVGIAPYFEIFEMPMFGESGGAPSGTERYYSFDYGNIHFISLDSFGVDRSENSEMAVWLKEDLYQNELPWVVAFWHHPPYSKGSHDSDNLDGFNIELVEMRENIIPILESYDTDLVLSGHSHAYERSMLISNHYDVSSTFSEANVMDSTSGDFPDFCPYLKYSDVVTTPHQGTVYAVVGVSGRLASVNANWPHPAMYSYSNQYMGAMHIRVRNNALTAEFLTKDQIVYDRFVIMKDAFELNNCQEFEEIWSLFPNPGTTEVFFTKDGYQFNPENHFEVYDTQGNLIYRDLLQMENRVAIEQEAAGVYYVVISENESSHRLKFVKM